MKTCFFVEPVLNQINQSLLLTAMYHGQLLLMRFMLHIYVCKFQYVTFDSGKQ